MVLGRNHIKRWRSSRQSFSSFNSNDSDSLDNYNYGTHGGNINSLKQNGQYGFRVSQASCNTSSRFPSEQPSEEATSETSAGMRLPPEPANHADEKLNAMVLQRLLDNEQTLRSQVEEYKAEVLKMQSVKEAYGGMDLGTACDRMNKLSKQLDKAKNDYAGLLVTANGLNTENIQLKRTIHALQQNWTKDKNDNVALQKQADESRELLEERTSSLEQARARLTLLEERNAALEDTLKEYQETMNEQAETEKNLRNQLDMLQEKQVNELVSIRDQDEKITQQEACIKKLTDELAAKSETLSKVAKRAATHEDTIDKLTDELQSLSKQVKEAERLRLESHMDSESLQEKLQRLSSQLEDARRKQSETEFSLNNRVDEVIRLKSILNMKIDKILCLKGILQRLPEGPELLEQFEKQTKM